ncbi:MAG: rhamnulokinase [Lentisphaerae bacterium]|nr:rhamnulokinase [Lentisphaerota bacterium]
MNGKRLMAVDLGASGGKCFVGTFRGGEFAMEELHRFPHEGVSFYAADRAGRVAERAHWDDILLYRNIVTGLERYARNVSDRLDSIGIDTWGADGQFVNADGVMLGKIYCYRDHRLDDMVAKVKAAMDPRRIYDITGIHFQPFNVSNQLYWFMLNRREMLTPGCRYLPIPTVFYHYLGGVKDVDSSWASVTQLMDARRREWSDEILAALRIPREVMPRIVPPGTVLGKLHAPLAASVGLNRAALVAAAAHDTASAFAAAPVRDPDEALIISSGTWSLVGKLVPEPITSDEAMAANISNEGGIGNTRFLKNCMGTWLVQELRRIWRIADGREMEWGELTRLAESAPPFGSFVDPDDAGFYNPSNMETAIAEFCRRTGQPAPADRGACLRLVYESLALKYRKVNAQICGACGKPSRVVNVVGGGSRNELLSRFTADALGMPVVAGPEEATAVGNFVAQAVGLGLLRSASEAQPIIREAFPIREYRPEDTAAWDRASARFEAVCAKS